MTVSGLTMASDERQPLQRPDRQTHNRRSPCVNFGRFLAVRCSTPIWWRSARFSSWRAERERMTEDRVQKSAVRGMSIGEENERSIIPVAQTFRGFREAQADAIRTISERKPGLTLEDLSKSDVFISATLQASQIAMRTHQTVKRASLKKALVHVGTENSTGDVTHEFFLTLIDVFTVTHIEILRLFSNRSVFPQSRFRALDGDPSLTDPIVLDLNIRGLLKDPRPIAARTREPLHSLISDVWTLSNLGMRFLRFISE